MSRLFNKNATFCKNLHLCLNVGLTYNYETYFYNQEFPQFNFKIIRASLG